MRWSRKCCQRGFNSDNYFIYFYKHFFSIDDGWEDPNTTISGAIIGPPVKHVSLVHRWWPNIECCLGSFVILGGSAPVLQEKTYIIMILFIIQATCSPPPPPLDPTSTVMQCWCRHSDTLRCPVIFSCISQGMKKVNRNRKYDCWMFLLWYSM